MEGKQKELILDWDKLIAVDENFEIFRQSEKLAFHRQFDDFLIINSIFKYENKILGKIENN